MTANSSYVEVGGLNARTVNASAGNFPILNTTTINTQYANSQVYNTSSLNASAIYGDGLITTFGNMSCVAIEADLSLNLAAGTIITMTTTNGFTTINSSGGGSTDPLNISVGNISTLSSSIINVGMLNADNIEGFTKSTQYEFN